MLKSLFQLKRAVPPRPESPPFELYHCKFTRIQSLEKIKVSVTPTVEPSTEDFSVKNPDWEFSISPDAIKPAAFRIANRLPLHFDSRLERSKAVVRETGHDLESFRGRRSGQENLGELANFQVLG